MEPLFDRILSHERPIWATLALSLLILLLPLAAAYLDGILKSILNLGLMRPLLTPSVVIVYILVVSPWMNRVDADVIQALRSQSLLDSAAFDQLARKTIYIQPRYEILAFMIGVILGAWTGAMGGGSFSQGWLYFTWLLLDSLMFGLLAWLIYVSVAGTRQTAAIQRQSLRIDIFDIRPFEPIGRQSLLLALIFIGGITLSMVFSFNPSSLRVPLFWIINLPLALVPVMVFFLGMRPTHRLLAAEKKRELRAIQDQLVPACRELAQLRALGQATERLAGEINAMDIYERRLRETRTWPYNTGMLRALFFSVFIPLATVLLRVLIELAAE
jgi:hypothetical protein